MVNGGVDGAAFLGIMWGTSILLAVGFKVFKRRSIGRRAIRRTEREINDDSGDRSVLLTSRQ